MKGERKVKWAFERVDLLPQAKAEIKKMITQSVLEECSTQTLIEVIYMLNQHWHNAVCWRNKEIADDGCFWHDRHQKLYEFD